MDKKEELIEEYGYWGEHPDHPCQQWMEDVSNEGTRMGYWDWVIERESEG
jgi:hypothetical protein